jgi:hypothetical protein
MANVAEFFRAAAHGNLPRVQRMLTDGDVLIADADVDGRTALSCAAGDSDALRTLT